MARIRSCCCPTTSSMSFSFHTNTTSLPSSLHQLTASSPSITVYRKHPHTTRSKHHFRTLPAQPTRSLADAITSISERRRYRNTATTTTRTFAHVRHKMAAVITTSTMEDLMSRMNWRRDQTTMVGIIVAVVSPVQRRVLPNQDARNAEEKLHRQPSASQEPSF